MKKQIFLLISFVLLLSGIGFMAVDVFALNPVEEDSELATDEVEILPVEITDSENKNELLDANTRNAIYYNEEAKQVALEVEEAMFTEFEESIEKTTEKLGYLAGDTLDLAVKNLVLSKTVTNHYFTDNTMRFNGHVEIKNMTFDFEDDTVKAELIDIPDPNNGNNKKQVIRFTRLKNKRTSPEAPQVNVTYDYAFDFLAQYKNIFGFWVNHSARNTGTFEDRFGFFHCVFLESAPELVVEPGQDEPYRILINQHFDSSTPEQYYQVITSAGQVSARFTQLPDVTKEGVAYGELLLEDMYHQTQYLTITFDVYDQLVADAVPQKMPVGMNVRSLDVKKVVENVRFHGKGMLDEDAYTVKVINSNLSIPIVGFTEFEVLVKLKNSDALLDQTIVKIPLEVTWGNTLRINTHNDRTMLGLLLRPWDDDEWFVSTVRGKQDNLPDEQVFSGEGIYTLLSFGNINESGKFEPYKSHTIYGFDKLDEVSLNMPMIDVKMGDLLGIVHTQMGLTSHSLIQNYVDNEEQSLLGTDKADTMILFEVVPSGFRQILVSELDVKGKKIPLYASKEEMDEKIEKYVTYQKYPNIKVSHIIKYPDTSTPGIKKGSVMMEETLVSGKRMNFEYEVDFEVESGKISFNVPEYLDFDDYQLGPEDKILTRKQADWGIQVEDTRDSHYRGKWRLMGQLSGAKNDLNHLIYFIDKDGRAYNLMDKTTILTHDASSESGKTIVQTDWEDEKGIVLSVPKNQDILPNQKYESTIEWTLVIGEE